MTKSGAAQRSPLILAAILVGAAAVLSAGAMALTYTRSGPQPSSIGGPFALTDQDGKAVTDTTYRGTPTLVFFGYTHCPDVCPTTLADMTAMLGKLGKDAKVAALFVTVDPERDTPKVMKEYVSNFDSRIQGLTGSPAQVATVEHAYRVYAKKVPDKNGVDYSMDHTSIVYVMDAQGHFVNALNLEQAPQAAADEFTKDVS